VLNHRGRTERVSSSFQMMLILSVIHVRTPDKHRRQSEFSYWSIPKCGPFICKP
jgi:hypothetical protein